MDEINNHVYINSGWHWSYGWLRRPELDEPYGYCYEEPDGDLVYIKSRKNKLRVFLDCWRDENGELYICISKSTGPEVNFKKTLRTK